MRFFRYLTLLFCLCAITLTQAQRYEVDCLVSSEIKAVATDKSTEFDGTRTVLYLLTSSLKKHAFYNLLINNILYLCVT